MVTDTNTSLENLVKIRGVDQQALKDMHTILSAMHGHQKQVMPVNT